MLGVYCKSSKKNHDTSYNLTYKSWNQVWVDNSGFSLTLKGNSWNKKMILRCKMLDDKMITNYKKLSKEFAKKMLNSYEFEELALFSYVER